MEDAASVVAGQYRHLIDGGHLPESLCHCHRVQVSFHLDKHSEVVPIGVDASNFVAFHRHQSSRSASLIALLERGDILPPLSALMTVERPK